MAYYENYIKGDPFSMTSFNSNSNFQDMLVPVDQLKASLECFHKEVEIYPIWLCPFQLPNHPGMLKIDPNRDTSL